MPRPLPSIDFRLIREHVTSQQRAFEELCYQLVPALENLPPGTELHRRGTPDGGIEFWCAAPDGRGKWAWQAKFLFDADASAFQQMTRSVKDTIPVTPDLRRYTFLLPANLSGRSIPPAPGRPRRRSGEQRWETAVAAWDALAKEAGLAVDFRFRGHSELLATILDGNHDGAVRYWFDAAILGPGFFRERADAEIKNLGRRYRPALHVELDVADRIEAVARSAAWLAGVDEGRRRVRPEDIPRTDVPDPLGQPCARARQAVAEALDTIVQRWDHLQDPSTSALEDCEQAARRGLDELRNAIDLAAANRPAEEPDTRDERLRYRHAEDVLWAVSSQLTSLVGVLADASAGQGRLLITGPAGCGKSHLVADVVRRHVEDGAPALLLLGQRFSNGEIWPQVASILGLDLPRDDLLQALSVAAASANRGRLLIAIDAINEQDGALTWRSRLPGVLADVARHPWISMVLTVRDTYEAAITDDIPSAIPLARAQHPGFDGHEEEALDRFSTHYGLRLVDLPPMLPELTNPLFLVAMCEALQAEGMRQLPREELGISWVFRGWIDAVEKRLSARDRLDFGLPEHPVGRALDLLAELLLNAPMDGIAWGEANRICQEVLPSSGHSLSLLAALAEEGILIEDAGPSGATVRFTYQRLADFRMASQFISRNPSGESTGNAVRALLADARVWRWSGLLEALAVQVPEELGLELLDAVMPPSADDQDTRRLRRLLASHLITSLEWRSTRSINARTLELARSLAEDRDVAGDEWLSMLIRVACVPGHPFNMRHTHPRLAALSLTDRDLAWTHPLLMGAGSESVFRALSWGLHHGEDAPPEVANVAALFFGWLLTSPNRRVRDRATKALVRVLERHATLWAPLISDLGQVNDAYVVERVLAACLGWLLRHRRDANLPLECVQDVAEAVYDAVFAGPPPRHLMIRHYARCIVEIGETLLQVRGRGLGRDLGNVAPPYSSDWPLDPPSREDLEQAYGPEGHWRVIDKMDDFYRYTISGAIRDFAPKETRKERAVRRLLATQQAEQADAHALQAIEEWLRSNPGIAESLAGDHDGDVEIPDVVRRALSDADFERRRSEHPERPRVDADVVARAVSRRVLDLGWTQDDFGSIDRSLGYGRSRSREPMERFGKKYAWIALYEVLGQLADHCDIQEPYAHRASHPYHGPWDVGYTPDIDPSHVLAPRPHGTTARQPDVLPWWKTGFRHQLDATPGDHAWLLHSRDVPPIEDLLAARDPSGSVWVALEAHGRWKLGSGRPRTGSSEDHRSLWIRTQAYVIRAESLDRIQRWSAGQNWMGLWMPMPGEYSDAYMGSYPDLAPWPEKMHLNHQEHRRPSGWQRVEGHRLAVPLGDSVARYTFDRERDFSGDDGGGGSIIPAPLLLDILDARWTPNSDAARELGLGPSELERSWSSRGRTVAFYADGDDPGDGSAFFVRADDLLPALERSGMAVWSWVLGEKGYVSGWDWSRERTDVFAAGSWDAAGWTEWSFTAEYVDHEAQAHRVIASRRSPRLT